MRPDDPRARLARDWVTRAQRDLASSERLLADPAFPVEAAFHTQQAAEKALKGLLAWHDIPFATTHDLAELLEQCATVAPDVRSFHPALARLTRYAVAVRYPGLEPEPSADAVRAALDLARQVVLFVLTQLPPEVRP